MVDLEKRRLKLKTIRIYRDALVRLASESGNLDDSVAVATVIANIKSKTLLETTMAAYNHYSRVWKLPRVEACNAVSGVKMGSCR